MPEQAKPSDNKQKGKNKSRRVQGPSSNKKNSRNNNSSSSKKNANSGSYIPWNRNVVSKNNSSTDGDEDAEDTETCLICTEKLVIVALSDCGHKTCHKCTLRQRSLYQKPHCLICRSEYKDLIFTSQVHKEYSDLAGSTFEYTDPETSFHFLENNTHKKVTDLLHYRCPMKETDEVFKNFNDYNSHLKKTHNRTICTICAEFKFEFPSEMDVFTHDELKTHNTKGDPKNGFFGHPVCGFCSGKRFYSDDELYKHMREHHERCHICHQVDPKNPQWFKDYNQLFEHFKNSHFVCTQRQCLDAKFVVFKTEIDMQAHMVQDHGIGKNLNLLDSFNNNYSNGNTNNRIATARENSRRFQSELSTFQPSFLQNQNEEAYVRSQSLGNRHNQNTNSDSGNNNVKRLRFEERARHYLHYNLSAFESFNKMNTDYSNDAISAHELLKKYESLFTEPEHDISLLFYEFANLFPSGGVKNKELLAIYENLKGEKQKSDLAMKFPPLDGGNSTPAFNNSWAGNSSSRVGSSRASRMNFPALPGSNYNAIPKQTKKPVKTIGSSVTINSQKNKFSTPSFQDIYGTPAAKPATNSVARSLGGTVASSTGTNKGRVSVDQSKFPPLPTVQVKRAPPVNPIIPSTPGNFHAALKAGPKKTYDPFDVENLLKQIPDDKGKGKKGKKQLLMHIGI